MTQLPQWADSPCECPNAGWCDRHKFTKNHNQRQLCIESARYRKHWDYKAPFQTETPPEEHEPAAEPVIKSVGLGDMVAAVTRAIGVQPCGGCKKRQAVLNNVSLPVPAAWAPAEATETKWAEFSPPDGYGVPDDRWAVAVTTAPRKPSTLIQSMNSLIRTGWTDVRIFAEPGSVVPKIDGVTVNERPKGPFQNWRSALEALRDEKPDAEFYMVCQDDVLYSRGLKAFLESDLWFDDLTGFVSPYRSAGKSVKGRWTPAENYMDRKDGFRERCKPRNGLWGALTYIFPRRSVDILLSDEGLKKRERMIDLAIHPTLAANGLHAWYYNPSLAEHMKGTSTLKHGQGKGMNSGGTFRGEEFDCLSLLEGVNA